MTTLFGGVLGVVLMAVLWNVRQRAMKNRLQGFDDGSLCISCHSRNMRVQDGKAHCHDCRHVSDLAIMQRAVLSDEQIAAATKPQN
jgi:hypothetical protein